MKLNKTTQKAIETFNNRVHGKFYAKEEQMIIFGTQKILAEVFEKSIDTTSDDRYHKLYTQQYSHNYVINHKAFNNTLMQLKESQLIRVDNEFFVDCNIPDGVKPTFYYKNLNAARLFINKTIVDTQLIIRYNSPSDPLLFEFTTKEHHRGRILIAPLVVQQ